MVALAKALHPHSCHRALWPVLALTALASSVSAQQVTQKVTGPVARYWLSAETASGMPMMGAGGGGASGGLGAMLGMMSGMGGGPRRSLLLELGSVRDAADPAADHSIPGGMSMGPSLPLLAPERSAPSAGRSEDRDIPEQQERPEGNARMLFFWGCGENAGPGQPVILDMKQIMDGKLPPNMQSYPVTAGPTGPQVGRDRSYANWPNRKDSKPVPSNASMVGNHAVQGNFNPDIRFGVAAAHDFMEGLNLANEKTPAGALQLRWNAASTAIGYFSTAMGFKQTADKSADMVLWNSSAKRMLGGERLMGFLPPGEVARLQRDNVVMPASQTECLVPKQALEAAGGNMVMMNLNGFGPELNVVYPPRPLDPKVDWNQEYTVKLRLRSYTSSIAGMPSGGETRPASQRRNNTPAAQPAPSPEASTGEAAPASPTVPGKPDIANAVEGGVKLLKGLFGR